MRGSLQDDDKKEDKGKDAADDSSDDGSEAGNFSPELDAGMTGGEDVVDEAEVCSTTDGIYY